MVSRRNDSHVTYLFYDRFSFTSNEMDQSSLIMVSQAGLGNLTISFGEMSTSNRKLEQEKNYSSNISLCRPTHSM